MPRTRPELTLTRRQLAIALGRRLAAARIEAGRTQSEVAQRLGVPQSTIAKIELGQRVVTFLEARDLAKFYRVPASRLDPR